MTCLATNLLRVTLLLLTVLVYPVGSQPVAPQPPEAYDTDRALQHSQAVLGKPLRDYELLDSNGNPIHLRDFSGKPLLVSLVYTSCYHTCPVTTRRLAKAVADAREVLGEDSFRVVTIGFDTAHDSPQSMASFARSQAIDSSNWGFLSGSPESMAKLVADLGFIYFSSPRGFDHIVQLTIVDRSSKIYRQVYGEVFELPSLVEPLKDLVFNRSQSAADPLTGLTDRIKLFCTVYDPGTGRYKFDYSLFFQIGIGLMIVVSISVYLVREAIRARRRE